MKRVLWLVVFSLLLQGTAFADASNEQMMDVLQKMQKQMADMQRTIETQSIKIQQLESARSIEILQPAATMSEADWEKGIKDNVGQAIPWIKGVKFGGDLRLREEYFDFFDKNNDAGSTGTANDRTRARTRLRLRYGMEKDFGDDWKAGFRLASGSSTDNASTNQTLGNRGYFTFKDIFIDRAYAQYSPNGLKDYGPVKGVTIGAGKFENPFQRYGTTITWDGDITPEGLYEKAKFSLVSTETNKLDLNVAMGQFLINENAGEITDSEMFGYQGALTWSTYNFGDGNHPVDITGAVSLYDYVNLSGTLLAAGNTAATSYQRTNTTAFLLDDPRIIDFYPEVVFYWGNTPVTLWYNYVMNEAELNAGSTSTPQAADVHNQDDAFGLGFKLGKLKKKDWEFFYGYYEIGANAVPAAFNDSDFGGPGYTGHTNRLGHKFGLGYQLTDSLQFNWTNFLVRPLNATAATVAGNALDEKVYRTQADLVWKF